MHTKLRGSVGNCVTNDEGIMGIFVWCKGMYSICVSSRDILVYFIFNI